MKPKWIDDGSGHRGKCDADKQCPALRIALDHEARTRGLDWSNMINITTGRGGPVIVYRLGGSDMGIPIRFCPFCGGAPNAVMRARLAEPAPAEETGS